MKLPILLWLLLAASLSAQVKVESLPEPGIQPQVAVTAQGVVHLVYLKGDPKACDIRYAVRHATSAEWSIPVTVNSRPHSAIAAGTIRGAQIALGRDNTVEVIWNGSDEAKQEGEKQVPLLFSRLVPGAEVFSPQKNLIGNTTALDGGASIAANQKGRVAVVWHAAPPGKNEESARIVYARYSDDDGVTFSEATALNAGQSGVCSCCSLRAYVAADGSLKVLFRAASAPTERGMWLIEADTRNNTTLRKLDDWRIAGCPMSSASFLAAGPELRGAWENDGQIVTSLIGENIVPRKVGPKTAKHPSLAQNAKGETLIISIIGSGWAKAGVLHWNVLDAQGNPSSSGDGETLPMWSYPAAYSRPDGAFVVLR